MSTINSLLRRSDHQISLKTNRDIDCQIVRSKDARSFRLMNWVSAQRGIVSAGEGGKKESQQPTIRLAIICRAVRTSCCRIGRRFVALQLRTESSHRTALGHRFARKLPNGLLHGSNVSSTATTFPVGAAFGGLLALELKLRIFNPSPLRALGWARKRRQRWSTPVCVLAISQFWRKRIRRAPNCFIAKHTWTERWTRTMRPCQLCNESTLARIHGILAAVS
jgi:hypothetical protein